ncbi:MAG TPA: hypothetical protein VLA37_07005 [Sphingomonadaceae bacterium]|nr:hypothetical protein [Sphingomonadaceae bacterium]
MNRIANHVFATIIALMLTIGSFNALISIPAGDSNSPVELA